MTILLCTMFKLEIEENSKDAGLKDYMLMTADARSLEARVATADTALNPQGLDPVLSEVYREGSPMGEDLHSMTAFNTFFASVDREILDITDENGKKWCLCLEDSVKIKRDNQEMIIKAADLNESDTILDYV